MCCGKYIKLPKFVSTRELKEIKPREVRNEKDIKRKMVKT